MPSLDTVRTPKLTSETSSSPPCEVDAALLMRRRMMTFGTASVCVATLFSNCHTTRQDASWTTNQASHALLRTASWEGAPRCAYEKWGDRQVSEGHQYGTKTDTLCVRDARGLGGSMRRYMLSPYLCLAAPTVQGCAVRVTASCRRPHGPRCDDAGRAQPAAGMHLQSSHWQRVACTQGQALRHSIYATPSSHIQCIAQPPNTSSHAFALLPQHSTHLTFAPSFPSLPSLPPPLPSV
jgi:hypothetical protein